MNKVTYPLAIRQSKATRLKLEQKHYDQFGTIEGMTDFEFRAIPIKAADCDERFEHSYESKTLFDLADLIECSEQGLREKLRAAYKEDLKSWARPETLNRTARYKGYIISYNAQVDESGLYV
jgi:hypothetical protein